MEKYPRVLLVAGEASADLHAASLLTELRSMLPGLTPYGVAGPLLRQMGMECLVPAEELGVVGGTDWFHRGRKILGHWWTVRKSIYSSPPDLAILLDLPDFNIALAKHLKKCGIPTVYYISPQVWAWRKYRIKKIKARIDHMLVFFPFEESFYKQHNVRVTQVGHPLIDQISHSRSKREPELDSPRLALLPGSRASELKRHTPLLLEVIQGITERYPKAQFQIPVAPTLKESSEYDVFRGLTHVQLTSNTAETLEWSDVAAVASGTATLETALTETPFCLFYRMSSSSYWFGRRVFGYRGFFGLPNFILGKEAAREFIQDQAEAEMILEELIRLLEDGPYRRGHISQIKEVRKCLGPEGASRKAAQEVYRWLEPSLSNSTPSSPRPNIQ